MKIVANPFLDLSGRYDLETGVVNSTCLYQNDMLFIGTDTGLLVLDENGPVSSVPLRSAMTASGEDLEAEDLLELLDGCRIRSIIRDSEGRLWLSIWRKWGLVRYDDGVATVFTPRTGSFPTMFALSARRTTAECWSCAAAA